MSTADMVGDSRERRVERLSSELAGLELDALIVGPLVDVGYLTGFTGSSGMALVVAESARGKLGRDRFFSDFRYEAQSAEQVLDVFQREIVSGDLLDAVAAVLSENSGRLGFDDAYLSVKAHRHLSELLGEAWELVPTDGAVQRLRAIKDADEIARIRAASELADAALRLVLEDGLVGRTERDVAIDLELRMRRLGAQAPSFPSIVASGEHGALPHAQPRDSQIPSDVLVTIDWGALHEGYCSDCTRTYATGEAISSQAREIYALVLSAEEQGVAAVAAGLSGREVDAVARAVIEQAGHGEHFGHGLGHGVGLEVHERPRLARTAGEDPLQAGNVVTVEPGIYLPGALGVRIEDLVVVGEQAGSQEVLTSLPKELTVVS
jgi:Xaa-Pro aminopeptidase